MSRRGKPREDMPWIESEDEIDEEFLEFIKNYNADLRRLEIWDQLTIYLSTIAICEI